MGGGEEGIQQPEEARAVLAVQEVGVKQRVEFWVKGGVVEVLGVDKVEEAREG